MPRPNTGPRLVLKRPKGYTQPIFFVRWYEKGRQRERSTGTGDRREAEAWFGDFLAARFEKPDGPRRPDQMTVATMLAIYGEERAPHTADPARIGYAIAALLPFWGEQMVDAIRDATVQRYIRDRGVSLGTARRELGALNAAGAYCRRQGYLTDFLPASLPERPPAREAWLTRQEAARLLRAARREPKARLHLPLAILLYLYTGARRDSVLTLQWQANTGGGWVDLDRGRIDFRPAGKAQTKKRRAVIPIPRRLLTFLRLARARTRQYVIEVDGKPVKSIKRSFGTARVEAGLPEIHIHDLKHTAISWLLQAGVPDWEVSGWTNTSLHTIRTVYGHHSPDRFKLSLDALG